jgi:hypothetical protein
MLKKLVGKMGGRKFVVSLVSILLVGISKMVGMDLGPETVASIAGIAATYVLGQSYADAKTDGKTSTTVE